MIFSCSFSCSGGFGGGDGGGIGGEDGGVWEGGAVAEEAHGLLEEDAGDGVVEDGAVVVGGGGGEGLAGVHDFDLGVLAFAEADFDEAEGFLGGFEVFALRLGEFGGVLEGEDALADFGDDGFLGVDEGEAGFFESGAGLADFAAAGEAVEERPGELDAGLPFVAPDVAGGVVGVGIGPGLGGDEGDVGPVGGEGGGEGLLLHAEGVFGDGEVGAVGEGGAEGAFEVDGFVDEGEGIGELDLGLGGGAEEAVEGGVGEIAVVAGLEALGLEVGDFDGGAEFVVVGGHALLAAGADFGELAFGGGEGGELDVEEALGEDGVEVGADDVGADGDGGVFDGGFGPTGVEAGGAEGGADAAVEEGLGEAEGGGVVVEEAAAVGDAEVVDVGEIVVEAGVVGGGGEGGKGVLAGGEDFAGGDVALEVLLAEGEVLGGGAGDGFFEGERALEELGAVVEGPEVFERFEARVGGVGADSGHFVRVGDGDAGASGRQRGQGQPNGEV